MSDKSNIVLSDKVPFHITEVMDIEKLRPLFHSYTEITGTAAALIDLEGCVLIESNWKDSCTQFHRQNEITLKRCVESDTALAFSLESGEKYNLYRCRNGLVDAATPIIIDGYHIVNVFTGQFFIGPPDLDYFRNQAMEVGFDCEDYLAAIRQVPVYDEIEIRRNMVFLVQLAEMIGEAGLLNLHLRQANEELTEHKNHLAELVNYKTRELREANDTLEEKVLTRTRELELEKERADAANQVKTVFLSRMSHELRTPLNAIIGFAQLLQMDLDDASPKDDVEAAGHILDAGRHLLMLIEDIMDVISVESREPDILVKDQRLDEIIRDSIVLVGNQAKESGVEIISGTNSVWVKSNKRRLKQILVNLLTNAIKYNCSNGAVEIEVEPSDDEVKVSVSDTGIGIAAADQQKIFEPFTRLPYAELNAIQGTGVGLALTKYLVEKMGGRIGLQSEPGQGSTFWVTVPKGQALEAFQKNASGDIFRPKVSQHKGAFIYIEDDLASRELVSKAARYYPCVNFTAVATAEEGIALADKLEPQLVVLDINLPEMDGIGALNNMKANPKLKDTYFIALSADALPYQIEKALSAGFDRYLTKPIELAEIIDLFDEFSE